MNERAATALQQSIEIWNRRANGEFFSATTAACPLCELFWNDGCLGCPVYTAGHFRCANTPCDLYDYFLDDLCDDGEAEKLGHRCIELSDGSSWPVSKYRVSDPVDAGKLAEYAKEEVQFLQSLTD